MTTVTSLGVDQLSLRGAGTDYNILSRVFATKAQADAALADSSWVPTAGKTNGCLTGDQGLLVYDFNTSALVVADAATRTYADTAIATAVAALVDSAPGTLDTLNELAAAINDDANAFATLTTSIAAVQTDVDGNESDADAAIAAVQADVDQNETDGDAADTALSARITTLEADPTTQTLLAAEATTRGNADTALSNRLDTLEADPTTATAVAAVQSDVNQNESDADAADAALSTRIDTLEADPTTATALAAVQSDVDQNEADADTAIALKADIASPTFTGTPAAPTASAGTNTTQLATTAYVTAAVAALIDSAPGAINTLNELAAALGDDANFSTTITNSIAAVQADVNQNETDADAAIAAVQADVDQNETDGDAADAALSARIDTLEADPITATASAAAYTALGNRIATLEADPTTASAVAAVQADVNQNESDADAAIAAVQADVDQNEADADTAIALKANIAGPTFTGVAAAPTASAGTNTTQVATTAFVKTAIDNLVGGASSALDTLNEIEQALNEYANIATNLTTLINARVEAADGTLTGTTNVANIVMSGGLTNAADDTAAASAGVAVNQLYRTDSVVKIRVS